MIALTERAGAIAAADFPPELLPASHPAWEDLESLWNRGGLTGLPVFTRPLPRVDIAVALAATLDDHPELARLGAARRLERELAYELEALGRPGPVRETPPPIEVVEGDLRLRAQAEARLAATTTGDKGDIPAGTRAGAAFRAYLPGGGFALADVALEKILDTDPIGDAIVKNSDWYLSTEDAYLAFRTRPLDLLAGLSRNRWGPGSSGTLLLSDAALSYPTIQLARTFGPRARATALTAELNAPNSSSADPTLAGPRLWFAAHRIELALGSRLRVGLHEAAAYRADGVELLYAIGVVPYTLVQRMLDRTSVPGDSHRTQRNNLLAGVDVAWRAGAGVRVDGEFLLDDIATESSSQPDRIAYQLGVSWAGEAAGDAADARLEFAKVYRWTYSVFYDADLVHDGTPLGYGSGPDVEHAEAWFERDFGMNARAGVGCEWNRKGEGTPGEAWEAGVGGSRGSGATLSGTVEQRIFPHVRLRGAWRDVAELRVQLGVLDAENLGHQQGADATKLHMRAEARIEW